MSMTVYNTAGMLNAVRNVSIFQRSLKKTGSKLSSGLKINNAADDPAGLIISEQMRSQMGEVSAKLKALDNKINLNNVADQAMYEMEDQLIELRELAVGAANSATNDENVAQAYQQSADYLVESYNRIASETSYGKQKLLDGSEGSVADLEKLANFDISDPEAAAAAIEEIDKALGTVFNAHAEVGATSKNDLEAYRQNLEVAQGNMMQAESNLRDTDYALEQANYVNYLLQNRVAVAVLAQGQQSAKTVFGLLSV